MFRFFILFWGSFGVVLGIENQFFVIDKSKFQNLEKIFVDRKIDFLIEKSILRLKNAKNIKKIKIKPEPINLKIRLMLCPSIWFRPPIKLQSGLSYSLKIPQREGPRIGSMLNIKCSVKSHGDLNILRNNA